MSEQDQVKIIMRCISVAWSGGGGMGVLEGCIDMGVAIQWVVWEVVLVCQVIISQVLSSRTCVMLPSTSLSHIHSR